ncbi:hypothetical protein CBM2637_A70110 [Cupriavidus taiwanensis]|uniref:hypothetical protein n=1 Tax=Cupriavidus taiwanensis TaxID=164546 RepID=UPI000E1158EA|nr:hypothetical protein [Cupriavidus taiwanensis]SPA28926.1 hypothetical protein CBM2637_A70110 [Cupriavidus taiwanensis]
MTNLNLERFLAVADAEFWQEPSAISTPSSLSINNFRAVAEAEFRQELDAATIAASIELGTSVCHFGHRAEAYGGGAALFIENRQEPHGIIAEGLEAE